MVYLLDEMMVFGYAIIRSRHRSSNVSHIYYEMSVRTAKLHYISFIWQFSQILCFGYVHKRQCCRAATPSSKITRMLKGKAERDGLKLDNTEIPTMQCSLQWKFFPRTCIVIFYQPVISQVSSNIWTCHDDVL